MIHSNDDRSLNRFWQKRTNPVTNLYKQISDGNKMSMPK